MGHWRFSLSMNGPGVRMGCYMYDYNGGGLYVLHFFLAIQRVEGF